MKLAFVTLLLTLVSSAVAGLASGHGTAVRGGPPCTPTLTKLNGHQEVENCGPATVTLRIGKSTYAFSKGYCRVHTGTLFIEVGTLVLGAAGNAGKPYVSLEILSGGKLATIYEADLAGKRLLGMNLLKVKGALPKTGSFTGNLGTAFSGSWNCHGVVYSY